MIRRYCSMLFVALAGLLAGCASVGAQTPQGLAQAPQALPVTQSLAAVTQGDLAAAIAAADGNNDPVGAACWRAVSGWLGAPSPAKPAIAGAFSALEAARVAKARIGSGVPSVVHVACAPVILDAEAVFLQLGLIAAKKALPLPLP